MQNDLIDGHLVNHNIFLGYTGRLLANIGRWVCWLLILTRLASILCRLIFQHMGKNMYVS